VASSTTVLELQRLRGGVAILVRDALVTDAQLHRTDEPWPPTRGAQHGRDQEGGRGLAVGARDANDVQHLRRVGKPGGSGIGQGVTRAGHHQLRHARIG
jgi:hypothetical protein